MYNVMKGKVSSCSHGKFCDFLLLSKRPEGSYGSDEKFHFENKIDQFLSLFMKRKNSYRLCVALC